MSGVAQGISSEREDQTDPMWPDLFYGVLRSPRHTLAFLANPFMYVPNYRHLAAAAATVLIALIISGFCEFNTHASGLSALTVIGYLINGILMWFTLSAVLLVVAQFIPNSCKKFTSLMIVTGWCFLPLIFLAPISCFREIPPLMHLLNMLRLCWSTVLLWFAFQSALKLDTAKMIALTLVLPPLLIGLCAFWMISVFVWLSITIASIAMHYVGAIT